MLQDLSVSDNRRFLTTDDGTAFFWLADTAWELFHKLSIEEAEDYLRLRSEQGFNVIQAVALAEFDGLRKENAYGRLPLKPDGLSSFDPEQPDLEGPYSYWDHVDRILDLAAELGLYIAFLPTWGDKYYKAHGIGPEIFNVKNAYSYGRWLGIRYKNRPNLIWVLGGDRHLTDPNHLEIVRSMSNGLSDGDGGRHLMTAHPAGASSSSTLLHNEVWLDFNMVQSGHGRDHLENYRFILSDYSRTPTKPVMDAEPCYEDHPVSFNSANGYFDAVDARRAAYFNIFSGGCGHTYGHHSVWSMTTGPDDYFIMTWRQALRRPGAGQMRHLRRLIESLPFLQHRISPELLNETESGLNQALAIRGEHHALIYFPNGVVTEVHFSRFGEELTKAEWFNPRNGALQPYGDLPTLESETVMPPSSGRGEDWVLKIESYH